ncbi:MAG: hypothetical protein KGZ49_01920, partial [Syntrophaceae bacterium]|nr:hypothetical protein [Syntrophaceae bacterium]
PRGEGRPFIPPAELGGILAYFYKKGDIRRCLISPFFYFAKRQVSYMIARRGGKTFCLRQK